MPKSDPDRLARLFADIASEAGVAVMEVYRSDFESRVKADQSPVSDADERAEEIILERLSKILPGVPVLAEEAVARAGGTGDLGSEFILVDPVDGTREFLKRKPDFTVNIALVADGHPVAGVVFAPARDDLYFGGTASFRLERFAPGGRLDDEGEPQRLRTRSYPAEGLTAATSSSHLDERTRAFLKSLTIARSEPIGSSLKFCLIARGDADVYPRWGPTMEWDTAAGHAVLNAAGGQVLTPEGERFVYGKSHQGYRNDAFVAWGGARL